MRRLFIVAVVGLLLSACVSGQKSEIVDFNLEKVEDIRLWDSIMTKQLEQAKYGHISLNHLSVDSFDSLIVNNGRIQLIDVRTEEEYNAGHIPGAILIDIKASDFVENVDSLLNKNIPVAVYCRGGMRSRRAAEKLLFRGFSVYNLDEGFNQWKKEGKKIEK